MNSTTIPGVYFGGRVPTGSAATLMLSERRLVLIGTQVSERCDAGEVRVSPRTGASSRFVALPSGGQFQCPDDALLDRLPQEVPSEGIVARLEQKWQIAVASILIIASLLAWGYWVGLPAAAERVAERVPFETERALGDEALDWLDSNKFFGPSELETETQYRLLEGFVKLAQGLPADEHYLLAFRAAPALGANAIALPGGTIVITDDLIELSESDEEILAILAHEIGHVEKRHTLRHILQDSAVAVVAATLTADAASLGVAVAGLPALLTRLQFSREFETEADDYAFELLGRHGISPEHFASVMQRMAASTDDEADPAWGEAWTFLSTHPLTDDRVAGARTAAKRFNSESKSDQ